MAVRSLNNFRKVRALITGWRRHWLALRHGVTLSPTASISLSARFVPGQRGAISVGDWSLVAFKTLLIARAPDGTVRPITIGANCFVGGGATILPGVTIGDGAIVGAGAFVDEDVPPRCAVGGNPARVLRRDLPTGRFGRLDYADANSRAEYR